MNTSIFRKTSFLVILIIVAGLFIRMYHLGQESLWMDEGHSIRVASLSLPHIIGNLSGDFHQPLYFIVLHGWINIFGDSEFSARFLSVLCGVLSIWMIFRVGRLLFDKETGILSGVLLCVSGFNIYYSQEVRMYSPVTFLTLLSMYYFIKLLQQKSFLNSGKYLLFTALLFYTHHVGIYIIAAQNIYVVTSALFFSKSSEISLKRWLGLQVALIVIFAPWIWILLSQISRWHAKGWATSAPVVQTVIHTFTKYSGSRLLKPLLIILSIFSIFIIKRSKGATIRNKFFRSLNPRYWDIYFTDVNTILLLGVWLLAPIILPFVISRVLSPVYTHRLTIGASLAFYLLVARGIRNLGNTYLRLVIFFIIVILSLVVVRKQYLEEYKDQWREAVSYIEVHAELGDRVLVCDISPFQNVFQYYFDRSGLPDKGIAPEVIKFWRGRIFGKLIPAGEDSERVWVVLSHHSLKNVQLIRTMHAESCSLIRYKEYSNRSGGPHNLLEVRLEIYLFEKKGVLPELDEGRERIFTRFLQSARNSNLVKNSGFERQGAGWIMEPEWLSSRVAYSGDHAGHIEQNTVPEPNFWALRQQCTVRSMTTYLFGAFVKTKDLQDEIMVEINEFDSTLSHHYYQTDAIKGDNDWTLLLGVFRPHSLPGKWQTRVEVRAGRVTNFHRGEFWVDDVFIIPYDRFPHSIWEHL